MGVVHAATLCQARHQFQTVEDTWNARLRQDVHMDRTTAGPTRMCEAIFY